MSDHLQRLCEVRRASGPGEPGRGVHPVGGRQHPLGEGIVWSEAAACSGGRPALAIRATRQSSREAAQGRWLSAPCRQRDRQTGRETDRQTDRHRHTRAHARPPARPPIQLDLRDRAGSEASRGGGSLDLLAPCHLVPSAQRIQHQTGRQSLELE